MSRADHELANTVLRDALLAACDAVAALAVGRTDTSLAENLATWRALVERTRAEDEEDDPPFSEHAREAAWRSWIAAHRRCNFDIKVDRAEMDAFRDWWFTSAERRRRGELDYNAERLTAAQVARMNASERGRYAVENDE